VNELNYKIDADTIESLKKAQKMKSQSTTFIQNYPHS